MSLWYLYLPISSSLVNWMTRWCKLETRHHHNTVLTSSTAACFLGCLKLNLCFQGLGGRFSGPGVLNIVSGSRVALVAFSLLLLFMPLYRSMAASSALAQTSMVEMETGGKSTGLWRFSSLGEGRRQDLVSEKICGPVVCDWFCLQGKFWSS